jgi:hypothetical protein
MSDKNTISKPYFISVSLLTFLMPCLCTFIDMSADKSIPLTMGLFGKWFVFSAVGLRLLVAGIKQTTDPAFTARKIFHLEGTDALPIVRELGFANICFGLIGIASLAFPSWRLASAFGSGLYYGFAGLQHIFKKPAGVNERFALFTDVVIFLVLLVYFVKMI